MCTGMAVGSTAVNRVSYETITSFNVEKLNSEIRNIDHEA
jgi:hypothetical protein